MQNSVFPAIKKLRPNIKYVAPGHNDKILNLIKKYMMDDYCDHDLIKLTLLLKNNNYSPRIRN